MLAFHKFFLNQDPVYPQGYPTPDRCLSLSPIMKMSYLIILHEQESGLRTSIKMDATGTSVRKSQQEKVRSQVLEIE